ncbi:MAG: flagellin FliC [Rhizobacter sp.]|nr:flagellin FliC [Bacteriovorax sp.]
MNIAMRVSTNTNSMTAMRYVQQRTEEQSIQNEQLSSGDRIARAEIDPAGLAISEGMRARIRSNYQAERNSNDSISLLQVAEGSLGVMQGMGIRLRELAMQSANDTLGDGERTVIDSEFQQLKQEVKRITASTTFNGNHIIKGSDSVYDLQVGINGTAQNDRLRYDMGKVMDADGNFGIGNVDLKTKYSAQNSLTKIDKMMSDIGASRAQLGSMETRVQSVIQNLQVYRENTSASNSKIRDTDVAAEAANRIKTQIGQSASLAMLKISNDAPGMILKLVS